MSDDLATLLDLAVDLTRSMGATDRYEHFLATARRALRCDATALLRLDGDTLVPLAAHGLVPDVLGARFPIADHPRLRAISEAQGPIRFSDDSPLPDPFDGFLASDSSGKMRIHACLGCPLRIDGRLIGALTADAAQPGAFDDRDPEFLSVLGALAGAALHTSQLIESVETAAAQYGNVARDLMRERETRTGQLIGVGPAMQRLLADIETVAASDLTVLITGETGVGKELVAQAIHARSAVRNGPLIQVNCAALPESIAESELFGHTRGAFTGADHDRPGKFEVARQGSLFLDEIGELPLVLQPKLLRALQQREIQRVGSDRVIQVDARILAASNRDLSEEVAGGRFRADLFHRLAVYPVHVPPLRERREDIAVLAGYFCDIERRNLGTGRIRLTARARRLLEEFDWPGNVRELQNVISRVVLRGARAVERGAPVVINADLVAPELGRSNAGRTPLPEAASSDSPETPLPLRDRVDAFKRAVIRDAFERAGGNWAAAARELGMHRSNLHVTAKRLGLLAERDD